MAVNTRIANRRGAVPIGSIIPWYDFNGALVYDTKTWKVCDGSVIADVDSPLNGLTLPDLANRYLVGFGVAAKAAITTVTVGGAAGTNYSANDLLYLAASGNGDAVVRVATVSGAGAVLTVAILNNGSGYSVAAGLATTTNSMPFPTTGNLGAGCTINVTGIAAASDHGTAAWATAPIGTNSHQISTYHLHKHNHVHTGPSHSHPISGVPLTINVSNPYTGPITDYSVGSPRNSFIISDTSGVWHNYHFQIDTGGGDYDGDHCHELGTVTATGTANGNTNPAGTGDTGSLLAFGALTSYYSERTAMGAGSGTRGYFTQSIQPQSVRVRFLMRIA